MELRTDMAMEAPVLSSLGKELPRGVTVRKESRFGIPATRLEIRSAAGARAVGKPKGTYVTLELGQVLRRQRESFRNSARAIGAYLRELLELPVLLPVLVAGLGNRRVTPDALGPMTADHILVTRHMLRAEPAVFGALRPVIAAVPGVPGTTGMESAETIRALCARTDAAAVIAVDALAARETERLCTTVQLSTAGIMPGSGVGGARLGLTRETSGVPVIALGVPTVTDAATLAAELLEKAGYKDAEESLRHTGAGMIVTATDIDRRMEEISRVLACGINLGLQPALDIEDLVDLTW